MNYWLVKSDPDTYSIQDLKNDKTTVWDGVRNYQARNYLKEMKVGDLVLFYHSQTEKAVVGIAVVSKEYFQDPTSKEERWVSVELKYKKKIKHFTLEEMKNTKKLKNIGLIKQQRLSVMPVTEIEFNEITK
ncbi:MAG: ubiquinol-cytochrome C reductase [Ignavibacteria bacterium GWF2_33_9]|nr:MAG: ubiquinol-cytochrome C reductase [Ignavibacteria bacterium GWF2_33_9]